ncbi:DNA polymerase [Phanerochaete sordida]|uniref:DNA polymerase eta n=1 Tax=Phanerochaete sordida TaxID=48140 RepID=A0A9P3GHT3_9APHY|nr:DNA polymerase [Phanerochaete sordida]
MAGSSTKPSTLWKGKARATEADYDDLSPVITYRHLHSHNLGVKDPLRVVALCDSDAFYAACEQVRLGIDPEKPLVVLQWQALIAVNYPARKYGISRMDNIKDAKKRCPHLEVVHVATYKEGEAEPGYWENPDTLTHKVSLDYYRRESWKIYHMFKEGLPTGEVEKASIDEAFIDFTRPAREEILRRYPYLAEVPPDAPSGKDTPLPPPPPISWDGLGTVIPVNPPPKNEEEKELAGEESDTEIPAQDVDELEDVHEDDDATTWHDVALSIAAELMDKIRQDIYAKLGYSTSAGIARNKFLAKLTASYKKPMNQSILRNAAIPNYLRPLPFQKVKPVAMSPCEVTYSCCDQIRFLGGKLGKALAEEYDVSTVGDLLAVSLEEFQRKFGEESIWVWEILRGIDRSEVKEKPPVTKSMQAAKNLPQPIVKASQGQHWVRVLAAELALRLREARESIPALWPKSLVLYVRQGYETSRSKQAPFAFTRDITVDYIAAAGDKLWKELVGTEASRSAPVKITHVSLSFSGIESAESGQRRIEGFLQKPRSTSQGVTPEEHIAPSKISSDNPSTPLKRKRSGSIAPPLTDATAEAAGFAVPSYICDRCAQRISLSNGNTTDVPLPDDSEELREALERLRREHDDFHFAQDLAKEAPEDRGVKRSVLRPSEGSGQQAGGSKRRKQEGKAKGKAPKEPKGGGIAKFFAQR